MNGDRQESESRSSTKPEACRQSVIQGYEVIIMREHVRRADFSADALYRKELPANVSFKDTQNLVNWGLQKLVNRGFLSRL